MYLPLSFGSVVAPGVGQSGVMLEKGDPSGSLVQHLFPVILAPVSEPVHLSAASRLPTCRTSNVLHWFKLLCSTRGISHAFVSPFVWHVYDGFVGLSPASFLLATEVT